ncbi:MAG: 50S ribosomal protein L10 [Spirochaetes bacterium]|nr:50S ribosomal protein L10 [Spirochaetota bacterium]
MVENIRVIKKEKQELFNKYIDIFKNNSFIIFADFERFTVKDSTQMRKEIRKFGGNVLVVKNNIFRKALEAEYENIKNVDENIFIKNTIIAYGNDNVSEITKALKNYSKNGFVTLKGAIYEREYLNKDRVNALANLPTRQQLYAMLANLLASPIVNLARDLNDIMGRFARVLNNVADKKK